MRDSDKKNNNTSELIDPKELKQIGDDLDELFLGEHKKAAEFCAKLRELKIPAEVIGVKAIMSLFVVYRTKKRNEDESKKAICFELVTEDGVDGYTTAQKMFLDVWSHLRFHNRLTKKQVEALNQFADEFLPEYKPEEE